MMDGEMLFLAYLHMWKYLLLAVVRWDGVVDRHIEEVYEIWHNGAARFGLNRSGWETLGKEDIGNASYMAAVWIERCAT